jgi:spermidine synthase
VGVCNLRSPGTSFRRWSAIALGVVALAVILGLALPKIIDLYAARLAASKQALSTEVRLVQEGRAATVSVIDQADPRKGTYRDMYLNGVEEASTRYWHTQLFKLLGSFPVLAHESEEPKEVLVIAFGAGITAGSVLASDSVSNLDVVDLNPDVEGINDLFTDVNGDVFHKPRFHFHNDDGRNYLVTSSKLYDVIISDSTHPRAYDSWVLYTEEFYEAVKERLLPGGIFAQWVPVLGNMQGDLFTIHLNTFQRVFPNSTFWYVYGSDQAFLLATPEPFIFDVDHLQEQLDRMPEWFRAQEYQIDTVTRIAGFFWMDEASMTTMIGNETRINTDDLHYFDKQSALVPAPAHLRLPRFQTTALPYLNRVDNTLAAAIREEQLVAQLVARYGFYRSKEDLFRAYCVMPDNGNVRYFLSRGFPDGKLPDHEPFCEGLQIRTYQVAIMKQPDDVRALAGLARLHTGKGRYAEAEPLLRQALAIREKALGPEHPDVAQSLDDLAELYASQGRHSEAEPLLKRSQEIMLKIIGSSIPGPPQP